MKWFSTGDCVAPREHYQCLLKYLFTYLKFKIVVRLFNMKYTFKNFFYIN